MVNVRSIRVKLFVLVLLVSLSLSGCSVFDTLGGWISQGYDNTVSYFNAYYNAKTLFDDAEAEVLAARSAMKSKPATPFMSPATYPGTTTVPGSSGFEEARMNRTGSAAQAFQTQQMPQTPQTSQTYQSPVPQQTSSGAKQKFAAVIDKCSNILSFYPKSSVVDDALFLIGKSYFYEDEFVKAERKFTELIVQDPKGPLVLDAQLWLLKTLYRLARLDDATRVGNELVDAATKAEKNQLAGEALEILGDVCVGQKNPEGAVAFYTRSVEVADNGPIRATAQSKVGDFYSSSEKYDKAAQAYLDVSKYSPDSYGLYSSQLQAAMAYRRIGQYETAIDVLRKLEADYRFIDFWSTIRFELASTFAANQRLDEAIDLYRLVDTTYARTEQGARAAYELGKILQLQMGNYADAKVAFNQASVGGSPDLTKDAQRRATALDRYFGLSSQFVKLDSMYFIIDIDSLWMKPDSSSLTPKKDTLIVQRDSLRDHPLKDVQAPTADSTAMKQAKKIDEGRPGEITMVLMKPKKDSLVRSLGNLSYQLGELFYTDLDVPDSSFFWTNQGLKLGLDSVKNARALFILAELARANPQKKYGDEKDLYRQLITKYPKSSFAEEARIALGYPPTLKKEDPAAAVFAVAESLMVAGKYQPAVDTLGRVVKDFPDSPFAPKSRYTMAWIYENNLANPDSALSQFKALVARHPTTKYGEAAQRRIPPVVADTARKISVVADTSKKTSIEIPKKAVVDTTVKSAPAPAMKIRPDTTMKIARKSLVDSLIKRGDIDEVELKNVTPKDTSASGKKKKEVEE